VRRKRTRDKIGAPCKSSYGRTREGSQVDVSAQERGGEETGREGGREGGRGAERRERRRRKTEKETGGQWAKEGRTEREREDEARKYGRTRRAPYRHPIPLGLYCFPVWPSGPRRSTHRVVLFVVTEITGCGPRRGRGDVTHRAAEETARSIPATVRPRTQRETRDEPRRVASRLESESAPTRNTIGETALAFEEAECSGDDRSASRKDRRARRSCPLAIDTLAVSMDSILMPRRKPSDLADEARRFQEQSSLCLRIFRVE